MAAAVSEEEAIHHFNAECLCVQMQNDITPRTAGVTLSNCEQFQRHGRWSDQEPGQSAGDWKEKQSGVKQSGYKVSYS